MNAIDHALTEAFERVYPKLLADPDELLARLQRRSRPDLARPMRPLCISLRSTDTRLDHPAFCNDDGQRPHFTGLNLTDSHLTSPVPLPQHRLQTVLATKPLLKQLCTPIHLPAGITHDHAAKLLGVSTRTVRRALTDARIPLRRVPSLLGRRGQPVPVIDHPLTVDPGFCALHLRRDPVFNSLWCFLPNKLPDAFSQPLRREYLFASRPDHPQSAIGAGWHFYCPACSRAVRILFLPLPLFTMTRFLGLEDALLRIARKHAHTTDPLAYTLPTPPLTFACRRCHKLNDIRQGTADAWNYFVSHLSGGLLFGHEVTPPTFEDLHLSPPSAPSACPHPTRPPHPSRHPTSHTALAYPDPFAPLSTYAKRKTREHALRTTPQRDRVAARLAKGHSPRQIAQDLQITIHAVRAHLKDLYRAHGIQDARAAFRDEPLRHLRCQLRHEPYTPLTDQARALQAQGLTDKQIAATLDLDLRTTRKLLARESPSRPNSPSRPET